MRNRIRHPHHGAADHIGGSSLNRRVDRRPFGKARPRPLGGNLRRVDLAAKQRLHITVLLGEIHRVVHILANAGEAFEIAVDEALRLAARDAQIACQAKARDAVDHTEIDRLGLAADLRCHLRQRHVKDLGGGHGVNVVTIGKGLFQRVDSRHVGQDAQLDLAVVERQEHIALFGDKGLADAATFLAAHGDVLQVGIARGQTPGVGPGLQVRGMHPARFRVDMFLQRVGIGGFQFRQLPPVQHTGGQLVLGCQILQDVGAGGIGPGLAFLTAR